MRFRTILFAITLGALALSEVEGEEGAPTAPSTAAVAAAETTLAPMPVALLWVPREDALDWDSLVRVASDFPGLGLTVAVSPRAFADIPQETLEVLPSNVEFAMRAVGDPVLPLVKELQNPAVGAALSDLPALTRPQDVIAHLSGVRKGYSGPRVPVPGFVPGGGAVSRELHTLFYPMGFSWVAAGPAEAAVSSGPWADAHGVAFVSFTPLARDLSNWTAEPGAPAAFVLDDTLEISASSPSLPALRELAATLAADKVAVVSVTSWLKDARVQDRFKASVGEMEKGLMSFKPWAGDYGPWTGQALKRTAWKLLASVAKSLDSLQNTGATPQKTLDAAGTALLEAEGGRYFLNLDTRYPAAIREADEREFRVALSNVFRILGQSAPEDLQRPLVAGGSDSEEGEAELGSVDAGSDWLAFRDPAGESGSPNPLPQTLNRDEAPALWDLTRFAVAWDTATVTFSVAVATSVDPLKTPKGFSYLMFDVYVDMNHRNGAGSTSLLPGRDGMTETRDAWEYAVNVTGLGGKLYRVGPEGQIVYLEPVAVRYGAINSTVFVDIPTNYLRGNPKKWGYTLATMALDQSTTAQDLWLPLKDAKGNPLLDVLAPWQREPLTSAQRHRLEAVRLK